MWKTRKNPSWSHSKVSKPSRNGISVGVDIPLTKSFSITKSFHSWTTSATLTWNFSNFHGWPAQSPAFDFTEQTQRQVPVTGADGSVVADDGAAQAPLLRVSNMAFQRNHEKSGKPHKPTISGWHFTISKKQQKKQWYWGWFIGFSTLVKWFFHWHAHLFGRFPS